MARRAQDSDGYSPRVSSKTSALRDKLANRVAGEQPDWGRIDPDLLWKVIQRLTADDGAVMFGYSWDGGSYSVKVYAGGEPLKGYFHKDEELIEFLIAALED